MTRPDLQARREALDLSRATLARKVGVSPQTIYNAERSDDRRPRRAVMEAIEAELSRLEGTVTQPTDEMEAIRAELAELRTAVAEMTGAYRALQEGLRRAESRRSDRAPRPSTPVSRTE